MIRNIVFDVGDVLVDFRYMDYMRNLGFDEECMQFLSSNMVITEFWHEMDLGIKTNADAVEHFTSLYPEYRSEIISFWDNVQDIVQEYDYAPELLRGLKEKGYGVYILSNYPIETAELHWPHFKFLEYTDGRIISGYEKITKPDEAIYRLLTSRFGIRLEESLFIDDREINIQAADRLGMKTILFTGYTELQRELETLGI